MRIFIYIFLILTSFNKSFSQELFGQKNTIEITQKWFFDHSKFKEPERKEIKIFNKKGRLIKDIEFGFHHNYNLNLVGNIYTYEYQKNKLISEKTYKGETNFKNNSVLFYWNYIYEDSRLKKINSNHSDYIYSYYNENKTIEWIVTTDWDSISRRYYTRYDNDNNVVEETEFNNWSKKYSRERDSLKITEYSFNFPKKGDTTRTYIKEVHSKGKIVYRKVNGFGLNTKKYIYYDNGQLKLVFTRIFDETEKNFKTELIYFPNGIIKHIRKYELEKEKWVLKQKNDFELNGNPSILNKREKYEVNDILINGNKNWLQQWL